jgi:formiminotetrahydrofolate cyclodeaminase
MDDSLFNDLVKSLEEAKEYVEGKKKLRNTKVNAAEEQPNCTPKKIEDEIDLKTIEEYEKNLKNGNIEFISSDEVKKELDL